MAVAIGAAGLGLAAGYWWGRREGHVEGYREGYRTGAERAIEHLEAIRRDVRRSEPIRASSDREAAEKLIEAVEREGP